MFPKFKMEKNGKFYIDDKYISNGHWMVVKNRINPYSQVFKALKEGFLAKNGTHPTGIHPDPIPGTPDMGYVIPTRDGYQRLSEEATCARISVNDQILGYGFSFGDRTVYIAPEYVPLIRLGQAFAKTETGAVIVLDSDDLNGELIAVVMPKRFNDKKEEEKNAS